MVVLSPPGRISPETPSRSAGSRTGTPSTPIASSVWRCSRKAPWRARTPIFIVVWRAARAPRLPAADREAFLLRDRFHGDAPHRGSQALRDVRDDRRVVEVGRRLDDRVRHPGRILALEDARPDEHALRPELHHERRVGRGRDPAGDEVHDRQLPVPGHLLDKLVRGLELLRRDEQLVLAHALEPADPAEHVAELANRLDDVAGAGLAL